VVLLHGHTLDLRVWNEGVPSWSGRDTERSATTNGATAALLAEKVPGSVLERVPECGHLVPFEEPHATGHALLRFLQETG